jgi:hypothetical protein
MGRVLPIRKPNPLAADDVNERVPHGTKATTQVASELLGAQRGGCLQDPVVCPAVVFEEQLNIIFCHDDAGSLTLFRPGIFLAGSSTLDVVVADHLEYRQKMGKAKKLPDRSPDVEE